MDELETMVVEYLALNVLCSEFVFRRMGDGGVRLTV